MDRSRPPRPALDALLSDPNGTVQRAAWLDALNVRLRPLLPSALAAHACLANVDRGRLVYLVDAPVWHAQLRLLGPQLLDGARSLGLNVEHVVIRTALPQAPVAAPRPRGKPMSAQARQQLDAALRSLQAVDAAPNNGDPPA